MPQVTTQFDLAKASEWFYKNQPNIGYEGMGTLLFLLKMIHQPAILGVKKFIDQEDKSLEDIKKEYALALLDDVANAKIRSEYATILEHHGNIASNKQKFSEEIQKGTMSDDFRENIEAISKLKLETLESGIISAKLLLALFDPSTNKEKFTEVLNKTIDDFYKTLKKQSEKDFERSQILYTDSTDLTRVISMEDLRNSEEINLSGEQREFIANCWNQGMYGWESIAFMGTNPYYFTQLLISAKDNEVQVQTNVSSYQSGLDENTGDRIEIPLRLASMTVDLSAMQGEHFLPCCSEERPKVTITITESPELKSVPEALHDPHPDDRVFHEITSSAIMGYVSVFADENAEQNKKEVANQLLKMIPKEEQRAGYIFTLLSNCDETMKACANERLYSTIENVQDFKNIADGFCKATNKPKQLEKIFAEMKNRVIEYGSNKGESISQNDIAQVMLNMGEKFAEHAEKYSQRTPLKRQGAIGGLFQKLAKPASQSNTTEKLNLNSPKKPKG